jgi:hypothetical protein
MARSTVSRLTLRRSCAASASQAAFLAAAPAPQRAIGVVALYFSGAVVTIGRARSYSHIVSPLMYMVPVTGALFGLAS